MNRRLGAALSLLGVPALARAQALPAPLWAIQLGTALQGSLLLLAAVFAGARFAPRVGLGASVIAALAVGRPSVALFRAQLPPALLGGLVIAAATTCGPAALRSTSLGVPLAVRMLYGGITEELLLRWGLMTLLAAGFARLAHRLHVPPQAGVRLAIVASAFFFGIAHLPALVTATAAPSMDTILFVVLANADFGLVAGWLYW
jgi:hypothetical protein